MKLFRPVIYILIVFAASSVLAQEQPDTVASISGITIETTVDKAQVYIGDLVNYRVSVTHDSTIELLPPPLGANLGAFDVKDYETDITTKLPDGKLKTESHFVLSTFTTGDYVVPPIPMTFLMPDSSRKVVLSETVPIKVQSLLLNTGDSTADIHPLKAQYEFERDYTMYYVWGGVALLFILAFAYFLWWRRKHAKEDEFIDLRPAWEIAFEKLAKLGQKDLLSESLFKQYYIELTEILRAYLGRIYATNIVDMTTDEFFSKYDDIGLPDDSRDSIKDFFNHADLVKFAKFVPNKDRCNEDFKYVHDLTEQIRVEFVRKSEQVTQVQTYSSTGGPQIAPPPLPPKQETVSEEEK